MRVKAPPYQFLIRFELADKLADCCERFVPPAWLRGREAMRFLRCEGRRGVWIREWVVGVRLVKVH